MSKEDVDSMLITAALGEELQMVETYSKVRDASNDPVVKKTLDILINDSRKHAVIISDLVLDISSKYSWELDDIDKKVAQQISDSTQFTLSKETTEWYTKKVQAIALKASEEPLNVREANDQAVVSALEMFIGSERTAFAIYKVLISKVAEETKQAIEKIMDDEIRHANMLNRLIWQVKSGEKEPEADAIKKEEPFNILYCTVCMKVYGDDLKKCNACGGQIKELLSDKK